MQRIFFLYFLIIPFTLLAQTGMVPYGYVLSENELIDLLDEGYSPELKKIQTYYYQGKKEEALKKLAFYFKDKFSERYFFDWKNFDSRFEEYNKIYQGQEKTHFNEASAHLELYPATVKWKMPFNNLKGEEVTAYPYRHLARQQKAGDIALLYFYTNNQTYLDYIPEQAKSLNNAFNLGLIETIDDGNGTYEAYRAGYRMFNWLFAHQCLLASDKYTWQQQIEMIRNFLHTGAQLFHYNNEYNEGNHQTRGMSALAMLSFLFSEVKGTKQWQNQSLKLLEEHLKKEIYADGFQFERSVHYHISDIENYFYPYQMAQINKVELDSVWPLRLKGLFDVLVKIALPNKQAPVLQDDTDSPWAEFNSIDETMAFGAVLFGEPEYNYFASSKVSPSYYWFLKPYQLDRLKTVGKKEPGIKSCMFPETGYYIMRQGWGKDDLYMIISAGLTSGKSDHQHGDMLGLEAYAYGNMVLPNYQVRYYLDDFPEFKNSWVKNVLLVDSIPQGREWTGNKGGSGFGKWANLPQPNVIAWSVNPKFDFFAGTHDGYLDMGVENYRSVIFFKDGFWIVKDRIIAENENHSAQQVWQGHYDIEKEIFHIRSVFPNGAGLEIIQLGDSSEKISKSSIRGKGRVIFEKNFHNKTNFLTLLLPFKNFEERLDLNKMKAFNVKGWQFFLKDNCPDKIKTNARLIINKDDNYFFSGVSEINIDGRKISISGHDSDIWVETEKDNFRLTNVGVKKIEIRMGDQTLNIESGKSELINF